MKIAVLGGGAWGMALASSLSARHSLHLWVRDASQRRAMKAERLSRYLPEVPLPESVTVGASLAETIDAADLVLVTTPTSALRDALGQLRKTSASIAPIVWGCKGFEQSSGLLPHQVVIQVLGDAVPHGALSGPSFALEVGRGQPAALTLASANESFARSMAQALHQARLRIYFSTDLVGVEVGGAVKNVMAIATGIADGLGLGSNARAALITRGLAEVTRLGLALGGRLETFMGLAGIGDLILTCTGELSRNRRVGLMLATGRPLDQILSELGHVAEGVHTAQAVSRIAAEKSIDMPITRAVSAVLFDAMPARAAVEQLLARDPKSED